MKYHHSTFKNLFIIVSLTLFLSLNYMYNFIDNKNSEFNGFQQTSETLVSGPIYANYNGINISPFGLGRLYNTSGALTGNYNNEFRTDDIYKNGYSLTTSQICISNNEYTNNVSIPGHYIIFENDKCYQITDTFMEDSYIIISLKSSKQLSYDTHGSLTNIQFLDSNKELLPKGILAPYESQYGLQGKIFLFISQYLNIDICIALLNVLCCILTALTFVAIVFILYYKYNLLMSCCFFITFLLSPWIVNFAKNLYWVEFTWFFPMLIGLFCSWKIHDKVCRIMSYVLAFASITIKCLCGYEYISTIMLGMISFLLIDFCLSFTSKSNSSPKLLLNTIIIMGILALFGFVIALLLHAILRGDGDIISGLKDIYNQDVLRRTIGADTKDWPEVYWDSFNASIGDTLKKYFDFSTEIITGLSGNLFPLLCLIPICIFLYDLLFSKVNWELLIMYIIFLLAPLSWFILAKAHSYIHTHMNFVLWYFGFVQICFYIICQRFITLSKGSNS